MGLTTTQMATPWSKFRLVLGKLRLLQKKAGSSDKIRDIERELHSTLLCARPLHEENLTLRTRLEEITSIINIFKEAIPPTQQATTSHVVNTRETKKRLPKIMVYDVPRVLEGYKEAEGGLITESLQLFSIIF
ncbi:hypothetical protein J6590_096090 [Homalodisca vitripennis]|nr:hypothetical protein J6590_096090 [Homalodisca vitripennis]